MKIHEDKLINKCKSICQCQFNLINSGAQEEQGYIYIIFEQQIQKCIMINGTIHQINQVKIDTSNDFCAVNNLYWN